MAHHTVKRLVIATNCKSMAVAQIRRRGWNPDAVKGLVWVESNPAAEVFLALNPAAKKKLTRLTTQFYQGSGLTGPDDKAIASLSRFEQTSMDEGIRWLSAAEQQEEIA